MTTTERGLFEQIKDIAKIGEWSDQYLIDEEKLTMVCELFEQRLADSEQANRWNADINSQLNDERKQQNLVIDQLRARCEELERLVADLAVYDTFETEYDGQTLTLCNECEYKHFAHSPNCVYSRALKATAPAQEQTTK